MDSPARARANSSLTAASWDARAAVVDLVALAGGVVAARVGFEWRYRAQCFEVKSVVSCGLIKVCRDRFLWLMISPDVWCLMSCGRWRNRSFRDSNRDRRAVGRHRWTNRAVFTANVFVLTSGCAWRLLPPSFGVTVPTAHRRFSEWTTTGLWRKLHRAVLDELGAQGMIDWSRAVCDGASVRAKNGSCDLCVGSVG